MKQNKGFTLIELLAVLVILAVIALITTPVVLSAIGTAKSSANKESARAFVKASEFHCATQLMLSTPVVVTGVKTTPGAGEVNIAAIGAKGTQPSAATLTLNASCVASGNLVVGGTTYTIGTEI